MDTENSENSKYHNLTIEILQLIQNKIFLGRYIEKRYVESLHAYRDIIVIESNEEIIPNLMQIKKILHKFSSNWIGISNDPQNNNSNDCLLWVKLHDIPIGKHWFQMSAIQFETTEIIFEVEHVQPFHSPDRGFNSIDPDFPKFELKEIFTYENMLQAIKFTTVLLMALFTFFVEALKFLGEYSIQFSHILVNLVHVSTPIVLGFFEFLTKCVGGLYWLIYVVFRNPPNTPPVPGALLRNQRQVYHYSTNKPIKYSKWKN